jgi:vanillate O-demethylase ferredoxin subunit
MPTLHSDPKPKSIMTNELKVRVARRIEEADGVCSFELVAEDNSALPAFSAGAHIDIHVAPGLIRQYSISNDPAERHRYRIAVLRESTSRGGPAADRPACTTVCGQETSCA